jgi:putative peptidoglycan lipid II flippase
VHGDTLGEAPADPRILRTTAGISIVTALARVAGFARWIVLGLTVGATYLGNTYQTANWVPNILFELAAGGLLSAVLVPTFVAEMPEGLQRESEVASSLANAFVLLSLPLAAAGIVFGRPIMRALTIGVDAPAIRVQQIELGAWFLRFFAPQIPLYVLGMVMQGVLHAHRRFTSPAAAPLFSSLVVIATYLVFASMGAGAEIDTVTRAQRLVLALGTTAGVVALSMCQLPAVLRAGLRWRPVLHVRDPAVRRAFRAGAFGAAYFAVTEVGLLTTLVLANRVRGGVVAWQVAFAFFLLPNALIGLPVAVSLFPSLAEDVHSRGVSFGGLLSLGWRTAAFLAAPAAAGLVALASPLAQALFRAAPDAAGGGGPELVASALRTVAIGLPAYALSELVVRAFYARHETSRPVVLNAAAVVVYVAIASVAVVTLRPHGASALGVMGAAHAVGQWAGLALGFALLVRRVGAWPAARDGAVLAASVARAAVMAAAVWWASRLVGVAGAPAAIQVLAGLATGVPVYAALSVRTTELRDAIAAVRRRPA